MTDKRLAKLEKILGLQIDELQGLDDAALKNAIVTAETAMKQARDELEANPKYQELKENLKALSAGLKDVKKHQNAVIEFSLHILEGRGK